MTLACRSCHRINPPGAAYCYFDGVALDGHARRAGATPPGRQPFPMPFTFPSGRTCHNFIELALACRDDWAAALAVLREGHVENFLGAVGRVDLAMAAREATRFPDPDRGLDQLLGRLPGDALTPPKLVVKTGAIDLGPLAVGCERRFVLTLTNGGTRLLFGSMAFTDTPWLFFGEAPNSPEKVFQFSDRTDVPVEVAGHRLRAGLKPLEGRIVIESNGGRTTIPVRATVPPTPFPEGVLKGALTPRHVAEKAKAAPKEAAAFFESGAVATWYRANGWTYPVQGPAAPGIAAVQQFFEVLCLTKPPRVILRPLSVQFRGRPGEALSHTLVARADKNRAVFASAVSDRLWLTVGRVRLEGRVAFVPLVVRSVPNSPGETLTAQVTVQANGNQRFVVPVTLAVGGTKAARRSTAQDEEFIPTVLPADAEDLPTVLPAGREPPLDELPQADESEDKPPRRAEPPRRRAKAPRSRKASGGRGPEFP
jgi:hypothetical protein